MLSTYWVTTAADSGEGSLRQAILSANNSPGPDNIDFNIGGSGVQEISLLSALPTITDPVTVDGTTQNGYAGNPVVQLDGSSLVDTANGLTVAADNSVVRGLDITGFNTDGVLVQGSGDSVQDNFIGVDPTGATAASNGVYGVEVHGIAGAASAGADIQGNVISANYGGGISFSGNFAGGDVIDNKIGVDASGSLALGNFANGVYIAPSDATLPGVTVRGNVISGNYGDGVQLDGAVNAVVAGNIIGTDSSGLTSVDQNGGLLSNFGNGVTIQGSAANDTIGGSDAGDRNVISGNFGNGVQILGGTGSVIQGNFIGTDSTGTQADGNYSDGIDILASGTGVLDNVVSGNYGYGVEIAGDSVTLQGNFVGAGADGLSVLGNGGDGVSIAGSDNLVGGDGSGQGNVMAFNFGNGVTIKSGTGNAIRGNSIYSNAPGIGIDLGGDGVTLNDSTGHDGPNLNQNFPVLLSASRDGAAVTVQGTLLAAPSQTFTVEFFSNVAADPSGYGQGQSYIGSVDVTTDAGGLASFTVTLNDVPDGQNVLAATATDAAGNTSEFSAVQDAGTVIGPTEATTATTLQSSDNPSVYGQFVTFTATVANMIPTGVPTGSITFMDGSTTLGTSALDASGQAAWTTSALDVGTHNITAVYGGANQFQPSTSDPLAQVVNPAPLTVTVHAASKAYGASVPTFADSITGFVNGDNSSVVSGSPGLATAATTSSGVGTYAITADQGTLSAGNYTFTTFTSGTLTVTPAPLTVTVNAAAKTYGDAVPTFTESITGFVNGDTSDVISGSASNATAATTSSGVGNYAILVGQGTLSASNYTFTTFTSGTLTVTPAPLTVTASATAKTYGASVPTLTDTIIGFVNGDDSGVVSGSASLATAVTAGSPVGSYAITVDQGTLSASNYTFTTFADSTLAVNPAALTVTVNAATKTYGAAAPALTDTITGFVNGDTSAVVSGTANLTTAATAGSGVGAYTITAAQGSLSASNYTFTGFTSGTLTINPAPLTLTANAATKTYGAAIPTLTDSITGFVNSDTSNVVSGSASLATTATTGSPVGAYAVTAGQGSLSASNYTFTTFTNGTLTVNPAALTVTANAATKTYGAAVPAFTDTLTGFVNGDNSAVVSGAANLTTTATASSPVGTYTITVAQGTLSAGNYTFATFTSGTLTVSPAPLTVTVNAAAKTYGAAVPTLTDSITGFVNGDTASVVSGSASLTTAATTGSGVGTYTITAGPGALSASNYTFTTFTNGTLTVNPAALTVTANAATKTYGAAVPAFTDTLTGFVNGDNSAVVSGAANLTTTATTGSGVGTYAITAAQGTLSTGNYTFTMFTSGTLTVNPAPLTVTAIAASKTYGAAVPAFTDTLSGFVNGDTSGVVSGAANLTTTATASSPVGTYTITVAQGTLSAGNYTFTTFTSGTLTVNPAGTLTTVTSSASPSVSGQSVTFTANVGVVAPGSGSPIGSINFMDGSTVLGTATLSNGTASLTTSALAVGTHNITAVYSGNGNFTGGNSAPLIQAVNPSPSSLSGYVYLDTNNDGVKQSTESGISGVQITLSGSNDLGGITPITVTTNSAGYYTFPSLRPGTYTITEVTPAGYADGKDTLGTQGGTAGNDVFGNIVLATGVNGTGNNFGELKNVIAGSTLQDLSGNGLSADDTAMPGVTVSLYLERDGNTTLDSGDGSAVATTVSDSTGHYTFVNVAPGLYYASETVPSGYVRTVPYLSNYYSVDLTGTTGGTSFSFDNFKQCTGSITNVTYTINNTTTVTDLRSQTQQGETVTVTFTVPCSTTTYVTLVTYDAPGAAFDATTASQQTIDEQVGGSFTHGVHTLTVTIPNNYYQIDFVYGLAIDQLGPAGSNIFYSAQNRLISADNAGTHSDVDDASASTLFWANLGQTLIDNFNVTDANQSPTALGDWLAQNFSNVYGSSGPNNMAGKTNAQVAAFFLQLYKSPSQTAAAQVLATALNVYASTTSLGGDAGTAFQFDVTDAGLGAADFNVLTYGSAFGVANNTTLTVWQILQATNSKSKNDVLYNGVSSMLSTAYSLYYQINIDGGIV